MSPAAEPLLPSFRGLTLWVVGDVMLDVFSRGTAERLSPEAPVPVITQEMREDMLGGAANVANNLAAQQARVHLFGAVGKDPGAERLRRMLDRAGIHHHLLAESARPTTTKTRVIVDNHQIARLDDETREPIGELGEQWLLSAMSNAPAPDAVIVSDYGKGMVTPRVVDALRALDPRPWLLVDPKHRPPSTFHGFDFATPNQKEAAQAAGCEVADLLRPENIDRLLTDLGGSYLITRSEDGMALVVPGEGIHRISSGAREVYDVTGAGDTAIALFALGLAAGLTARAAAAVAEQAAVIAISRLGTYAVTHDELLNGLSQRAGKIPRKLMGWKQAARIASDARKMGKRVVFTNGCFDLLHAGHLHLLEEASRCGDLLIVGLNDDRSVARLKGPSRPCTSELDRATVLSGLESVSAVVLFAEDTPLDLIETVQPDILVKGGDYSPESIVGNAEVTARGGEVRVVPYLSGYSTTSILRWAEA